MVFEYIKRNHIDMPGEIFIHFTTTTPGESPAFYDQPEEGESARSVEERITYHSAMKRRYERAAWLPWLSFPPLSSRP